MGGAHLRVKTLQRLDEALQTSEALLNKPTMQLFGFLKWAEKGCGLGIKKISATFLSFGPREL